MVARIGWLVVLLHTLIATVHGMAHMRLGITLSAFQSWYVVLVITVAPILAAILLSARRVRSGLVLLTLSMAGSLVFGVYWHYVAASPDNVFDLPRGGLPFLFRFTALALVMTEANGVGVGLWGILKDQKS